jgi:hypothetical protein
MFGFGRRSSGCGCQRELAEVTERLATIEAGLCILDERTAKLTVEVPDHTAEAQDREGNVESSSVLLLTYDPPPVLRPTINSQPHLPTVQERIRSLANELRAIQRQLGQTRFDVAA